SGLRGFEAFNAVEPKLIDQLKVRAADNDATAVAAFCRQEMRSDRQEGWPMLGRARDSRGRRRAYRWLESDDFSRRQNGRKKLSSIAAERSRFALSREYLYAHVVMPLMTELRQRAERDMRVAFDAIF